MRELIVPEAVYDSMSYSIAIDSSTKFIFATLKGSLTPRGMHEYQKSLWTVTEKFSYPIIVDCRSATEYETPTSAFVEQAVRESDVVERTDHANSAIVVSTKLMFGMARLYQSNRAKGDTQIKIFYDYDKACDWARKSKLNGTPMS